MFFDGPVLGPLWLVMLLLMPIAAEGVCPYCFGGGADLPARRAQTQSARPIRPWLRIALVAAVPSATAIAGGKFFKNARRVGAALSEDVYVCKPCGFAPVVPQVNCWHRLRAAGHDHCPRGHAGHPQRPDVIVGFGGFVDAAADEAAERRLMSKAKTIAEARDAGLLKVGLSSNADHSFQDRAAKLTNKISHSTGP